MGFLWFFKATAQPDDLIFRHITTSNGLPVRGVVCMAQDSTGFIWMGSAEGLFRYDGFTFKEYYHTPGDERTLPGNNISKIYVTRKGLLWIGTIESGAVCMDREGKIIRVISSSNHSLFNKRSDWISDIIEDTSGNIWLGTLDGLFRVKPDGSIACFRTKGKYDRSNSFYNFMSDASGCIWMAALEEGLMLLNLKTETLTYAADSLADFYALKSRTFYRSFTFYKGKFWSSNWAPDLRIYDTSTKRDIILFDGSKKQVNDFDRMVNAFHIDSRKNLWIATGKGLFLTTGPARFEKSFFHESQNPYSIINNYVHCILEDRQGNFWFGTKEGVSTARPYQNEVRNLSINVKSRFAFADKGVTGIVEVDSQTLLVNTEFDGIFGTNQHFIVQKHYKLDEVWFNHVWKPYYYDKPGNRIFLSTRHGMLLYHTKTHSLEIMDNPAFKDKMPISGFAATSDSILWMARFAYSFLRYNLKDDTYKEYRLENLGEKNQILGIAPGSDHCVWLLANSTGVLRFDERMEKITLRLLADSGKNALLQSPIWFVKDLGDQLLIGYRSKGISLYHKSTATIRHFSQADGLASNNTIDAIITPAGKAWIATKNGISYFDPSNGSFINYKSETGILNTEFNCISQLSDGRIAAGNRMGVVVFHPSDITRKIELPPPVITEIELNGKSVSPDSLLEHGEPLQVSFRENYFSFDFISPQYHDNHLIEYAYKLEGSDKEWIYCGNRRFASYSNLSGGQYLLKLKARLPGSPWVEEENYLEVHVSTRIYKRWWFPLVSLMVIAGILHFIFRYRLQQALKMERLRTTISGDLHDEVGASLTSISIFSEMAKKLVLPHSKEEQYLTRIGERSRESIEKMSDIIWSINPNNDSLQQMLIRMKNYASEVSEAKEIIVHWIETGDLTSPVLSFEQRKNFYLFFKEVMNNAIKHSHAKNIRVELIAGHNSIVLIQADDGKGFDSSASLAGNGLKSMHRRAELLHGTFKITSEPGKGTSVQLSFRY